ncbi:MAG TPA: hypothetical protein VHT51_00075, partial [Micropepsaceae bacterium]|nr:hypothetical protein [Micropepsaceae bacterium]
KAQVLKARLEASSPVQRPNPNHPAGKRCICLLSGDKQHMKRKFRAQGGFSRRYTAERLSGIGFKPPVLNGTACA